MDYFKHIKDNSKGKKRKSNNFCTSSIQDESTSSFLLETQARRFPLYQRVYKNYKCSLITQNPMTSII